jgi:hypothetical protein
MKTIIPILTLLLSPLSLLRGQDYTYAPYIEDDTYWSYALVHQVGTSNYESEYLNYLLQGDTLIDGVNYKKLLDGCSGKYAAAMREADRKVFIKEEQTGERLLYDFALEEGNSMTFNGLSYRISKIDTVSINHTKRKRFTFDDGYDVWIEGLGSLHAFYPLGSYALGYEAQGINYQKKGDQFVYQTAENYFKKNACGTTDIQNPLPANPHSIQLAGNEITLHFYTTETVQITLYDTMGRRHYQSPFLSSREIGIASTAFAKGVYILQILYKNRDGAIVRKIVL